MWQHWTAILHTTIVAELLANFTVLSAICRILFKYYKRWRRTSREFVQQHQVLWEEHCQKEEQKRQQQEDFSQRTGKPRFGQTPAELRRVPRLIRKETRTVDEDGNTTEYTTTDEFIDGE